VVRTAVDRLIAEHGDAAAAAEALARA
jgi:hypothetical protein